ncbi:hypothetical protein GCM10027403_11630 [Arthrobacter tecti]
MPTTFTRIDPVGHDHNALIDFMTRNEFMFHVNAHPTQEFVETSISEGAYRDEDNDSFWIDHTEHGRIGFFRLEDLSDDTPLFDLRLDGPFRNRGLGAKILRAATDHVFTTMPKVHRFEGQTREDNVAMRKTFLRCGWVKEAHYRESWPADGGVMVASVAYGILRRDWETGQTTTFVWEDFTI